MSSDVVVPSNTKVELNDSLTNAFRIFDDILAETSATLSSSGNLDKMLARNYYPTISGPKANGIGRLLERKLSDPPANFLKLRTSAHLEAPKLNGKPLRNGTDRNVSRSIPQINIVGITEARGHSDVNSNSVERPPPSSYASNVGSLALMLAELLGNAQMEQNWPSAPEPLVKNPILRWLASGKGAEADLNGNPSCHQVKSPSPSTSTVSCPEYGDIHDKLHRLETDRESLCLQVTVLSEQVGAQAEKIRDLETLLEDKKNKLDATEEMLQDELATRTDLETSKLDYMGEISALKMKFAGYDKEKFETEQRLITAQAEIVQLQRLIYERNGEIANYRTLTKTAGFSPPDSSQLMTKLRQRNDEIEQLKHAVQQLLQANADKDKRIDAMGRVLEEQQSRLMQLTGGNSVKLPSRQQQDSVDSLMYKTQQAVYPTQSDSNDINAQLHKLLRDDADSQPSRGNYLLSYADFYGRDERPIVHDTTNTSSINGTLRRSAANNNRMFMPASNSVPTYLNTSVQSSSSFMSSLSNPTPNGVNSGRNTPRLSTSSPMAAQLAAELNSLAPQYKSQMKSPPYHSTSLGRPPQKTPPTHRRSHKDSGGELSQGGYGKPPKGIRKWIQKQLRHAKRSTSAPNLGDRQRRISGPQPLTRTDEILLIGRLNRPHRSASGTNSTGLNPAADSPTLPQPLTTAQQPDSDDEVTSAFISRKESGTHSTTGTVPVKVEKKQKSLKNLLVKLKRSNSQEGIDDLVDGRGFKRGDKIRSTAGPRLAWTQDVKPKQIQLRPPYEVFCRWDSPILVDWLAELGLTGYSQECLKNIRSGRHLVNCRSQELEKELGVKNPLHRRKIILYLKSIEEGISDAADRMDVQQVLRWLDDMGMPQYRDAFAEAQIDGLMLDNLTVDDAIQLKISCAIHHASLSRGIQLLRQIGFAINRLNRKFSPEMIKMSPVKSVHLWSQHCVTDWLKSIDLTEFTPNLMCAGITGALMVFEPMFTAESLASVLQIPHTKTLLRRHLTTHFNQLLGTEVIAEKRKFLTEPLVVPLTPEMKIRPLRKGFSLSRKPRSKSEIFADPDELLCPKDNFPYDNRRGETDSREVSCRLEQSVEPSGDQEGIVPTSNV